MSRKIWFELIVAISLFVSGLAISYYNGEYKKSKDEIQRLEQNFIEQDLKLSELKLTEKEIKIQLDQKNQLLLKADSVIKKHKYKIRDLEKLNSVKLTISDIKHPDTVYMPGDTIYNTVLKKYIKPFRSDSGCIKISGFVESSDPDTKIALTEKSAVVHFLEIDVSPKWWQFWKPRKEKILSSDCSNDIEFKQINKVK